MNSLTKILTSLSDGPKKSNAECIVDHLVSNGEVALTTYQEELLKRVEAMDEMWSTGRFTQKEIISIHARKFGQSEIQSKRDLSDAEYIFGTSRRPNKRHKVYRHIERIETAIIVMQRAGNTDALPKLFDSLTKALALLPEDKAGGAGSTTIIMNFTTDQLRDITSSTLTAEEADRIVAEKLKQKNITLDLDSNEYSVE